PRMEEPMKTLRTTVAVLALAAGATTVWADSQSVAPSAQPPAQKADGAPATAKQPIVPIANGPAGAPSAHLQRGKDGLPSGLTVTIDNDGYSGTVGGNINNGTTTLGGTVPLGNGASVGSTSTFGPKPTQEQNSTTVTIPFVGGTVTGH